MGESLHSSPFEPAMFSVAAVVSSLASVASVEVPSVSQLGLTTIFRAFNESAD